MGTSGCIGNKQFVLCNVLVQGVCGPGWDKEPAQAEMRLTILLMGFRQGRRGRAQRLHFGAGAAQVWSVWRPMGFCPPVPWVSGQFSTFKDGQWFFGALGVMGFGGNERERLFGLAPRHPLYLVSLPTRPSPMRVNSVY